MSYLLGVVLTVNFSASLRVIYGVKSLLLTRYKCTCSWATLTRFSRRFYWATVCKTVHLMLSDRCPVCLSCLWRWCIVVGWIKIKLGMQVGRSALATLC